MYYAVDDLGDRVHISMSAKQRTYYCPVCGGELSRKMGSVKVHHFAHKKAECDPWYSDNKGPWHRSMQELFPKEQQEVRLENAKGEVHIADVCIPVVPDGSYNVIIEFQHSPLSLNEFNRRTDFYAEFGEVIWVFDITGKDIRKIPGQNFYRWYHPFSTLGKNRRTQLNIFFYLDPYCVTDWEQKNTIIALDERRKPFFLYEHRFDEDPYERLRRWNNSAVRALWNDNPGYGLLCGQHIGSSPEAFKAWMSAYVSECSYEQQALAARQDADLWVRFPSYADYKKSNINRLLLDSMHAMQDQRNKLTQTRPARQSALKNTRSSRAKYHIYLQQEHALKTGDMVEYPDLTIRKSVCKLVGAQNVRCVSL